MAEAACCKPSLKKKNSDGGAWDVPYRVSCPEQAERLSHRGKAGIVPLEGALGDNSKLYHPAWKHAAFL